MSLRFEHKLSDSVQSADPLRNNLDVESVPGETEKMSVSSSDETEELMSL